jgi:hypothetical protein
MLIFKTKYHTILLNSLHMMLQIKGYHGCDNAEYLWVKYDMQSERNLVSQEGAESYTLKKIAHSSETTVHLHQTAWCLSPEDNNPYYIILLLRKK